MPETLTIRILRLLRAQGQRRWLDLQHADVGQEASLRTASELAGLLAREASSERQRSSMIHTNPPGVSLRA